MRTGPHPLPVHLAMAAAHTVPQEMALLQDFATRFSAPISENDLAGMVKGIQLYQNHPYQVQRKEGEVVWSCDNVSLRYFPVSSPQPEEGRVPLLLLPSLVNKADIFNLCEERSFSRWMVEKNIPVYVLDWGDLTASAEPLDMDILVLERLLPALQYLSGLHGCKVDALGYCMGGTILLGAAAHAEAPLNRIVLLAAPWDFGQAHPELVERVKCWGPAVRPLIVAHGSVPASWSQALFASLDANNNVQKFIRFAVMDQDSEEAKLFVAVEDWLNDGVDLPGAVATQVMEDWFGENAPAAGVWRIGGEVVDLGLLRHKVLIVASHGDRIVPFLCAAHAGKMMRRGADVLELDCGHIGLIAGGRAVEDVWEPIASWLLQE